MKDSVMYHSLRYSIRRSIPILIGFFPVGVAYGILMANAGYNFVWSAFTSLFVYAGSLQMLMVSFFTNGASMATILITSLLLNSRHIFYGISFIEKFRGYGLWKYFLIYGLPDESYSLLCSYREIPGVEEKWVHIFSTGLIWLYWIAFSALGGLVGGWLAFDTTGIDFALTALFTVILVEQLKASATKLPGVIGAASAVLGIVLLGRDNFLLPALLATVAVLMAVRGRLEAKLNAEVKQV